jgi:hypothetical protein
MSLRKNLKFITAVLFILLSPMAQAEWTLIQTHDEGNMYIDFDSLKKADNLVTVTTLNDYFVSRDKDEMSSTWTELHDCKNKRFKALAMHYYKEKMGTGTLIETFTLNPDEIKWSDVVPYSVGALKANIICSR